VAATREKIGIDMLVQPKLDPRATSKVVRDTTSLHKKLSALKVDWNAIAKQSSRSVQELRGISTASTAFAKNLSKATRSSLKNLVALGDELSDAQARAGQLRDEMARTKSPSQRKQLSGDLSSVSKTITGLNKQINLHKGLDKKHLSELKEVVRAQRNFRMGLESAARYGGKDFLKDIVDSVSRGNALSAVGGTARAVGKAAHGAAARVALAEGGSAAGLGGEGGGGIGAAAAGISKAVPVIAGFATALTGLWKLIAAASDHQTKLNKALLAGTGTAGDFIRNVDTYKSSLDDLRNAVVDTSGNFLKLGVDSEQRLKILNKYATESTGSLGKTRKALEELGGGDLKKGVDEFTRSAVAYGKALNMEAGDVAGMMGKFESEIGYGASQSETLMSNIVKAAATANMPLAKFMDIFRSVTPNVELFTNRIEELTGVIKLLSKEMSPKDVKDFMDAFGRGFKGMSFKDRLGKVLVAGVGNVNKILEKDFASKAKVIAAQFSDLSPALGDAFREAFAKGDTKKMNEVLTQAKAMGAKGVTLGEASKLFQAERERKAGGPLSMASALKGGGLWSTIKVMGAEMKRFGMGGRITGIAEQVAEKRGYSQDQIDAMNRLIASMNQYQYSLKEYGTSGSKSMDKALRAIVAAQKGTTQDQVTPQDLAKATDDQIAEAAEASNEDRETARTAEDLATQQATATMNVSEKIDSVIGFMLEKIYKVMQNILDPIDSIWGWISGNKGQQDSIKSIDKWNQGVQASGYSSDAKAQMQLVAEAVKNSVSAGNTGEDLASSLSKSPAFENLAKLDPRTIGKMAVARGLSERDAAVLQEAFYQALKKGDQVEAMQAIAKLPGDTAKNLMEVGQDLLRFGVSREATERSSGRRLGTEESKVYDTAKAAAAGKLDEDLVTNLVKLNGGTAPSTSDSTDVMKDLVTNSVKLNGGTAPSSDSTDVMKDIAAGQENATKQQAKASANIYGSVTDVAGTLKKGTKYETSFLNGRYKHTLKEATLDSFNSALRDFAVIQAKLQTDSGFAQELADSSNDLMDTSLSMRDLASVAPGTASTAIPQLIKDQQDQKGAFQMGGPVPDTGLYKLHKGEAVLDASTYGAIQRGFRDGGAAGNSTVVHLTVHSAPNWTPSQFEGAVTNVIDRIARRQ
jgi:uncharacterized protein YihD (DUF1040 family)